MPTGNTHSASATSSGMIYRRPSTVGQPVIQEWTTSVTTPATADAAPLPDTAARSAEEWTMALELLSWEVLAILKQRLAAEADRRGRW